MGLLNRVPLSWQLLSLSALRRLWHSSRRRSGFRPNVDLFLMLRGSAKRVIHSNDSQPFSLAWD